MSYSEVHRLPLRYRNWFLNRLAKHFQAKNEAYENAKTGRNKSSTQEQNPMQKLAQFESQIKSKLK